MKLKIIFFLILIYSGKLSACECKTYPIINGKSQNELFIEDSMKHSSIIFYGELIKTGKFNISKIYKGSKFINKTCEINLSDFSTMCDFYFKLNTKYLVYGTLDESGNLVTSICLANKLIKGKKDLRFIKTIFRKNRSLFSN
mgnify:CR=1 FL=1